MGRAIGFVALMLVAFVGAVCGIQAAAAAAGQFTASITIDGHKAQAASAGDPILLYPDKPLDVIVEMTNHGDQPVNVQHVEFTGRVSWLNFYSYATPVDVMVMPGQTQTYRYRVDLTGLSGQATGL